MKNKSGKNPVSKIIKHQTPNKFSLFIEQSIIMPQNYRSSGELHIGEEEDGIFNPNSEDIYLVAQINDNIFKATIGNKTMYCILLSDKEARVIEQGASHLEDYEAAAKLRDTKNVFIYRNQLNDLLVMFGLRLEDCKYLFKIRVSQDSKPGHSNFDISGDTEVQIDSYELKNLLNEYAWKLACKGDSDSIKALATNLTSLNKLSNNVLAYLLFLRGLAEEVNGHTDEAKKLYDEAIKVDPSIEQHINTRKELLAEKAE